jgi:DNA-binding XRE family transcriptional regulator
MAKPANKTYSRYAREAAELLGLLISNARIERGLTVAEAAERAGISRGLVYRIEKGDPGCSLGSAFELAAIMGVRLFEADQTTLTRHLAAAREKLALLPRYARPSAKEVKDDF